VLDDKARRGIFALRELEAALNGVEQFTHEYRRRQWRIFAYTLADIAQVEHVAGREERFEEKVAVIAAHGAVALARFAGEQVETRRTLLARECAVIHADHCHHAERNAAHRQHRAEGDATGHETEPHLELFEPSAQPGDHHLRRNLAFESRVFRQRREAINLRFDVCQFALRIGVCLDEVFKHPEKVIPPLAERA